MKKSVIRLLSLILIISASVFCLTACGHAHSYTGEVTPPTCTEQGYTKHKCECGDEYIDSYTNPLGHNYGTPTYVWDGQNCTATRVCLNDNTHKETETVTGVYVKDKDATCTEPEKGHYVAMFSNLSFAEQTTATNSVDNGRALNHDYDIPTYTWDGQNCTATRVCLNDNTHKEAETVTGVYVKDTDATCLVCEKGHYVATFVNSAFAEQNTAKDSADNGNPLNHEYDGWKCIRCDTERTGTKYYTYVDGQVIMSSYIEILDNDWRIGLLQGKITNEDGFLTFTYIEYEQVITYARGKIDNNVLYITLLYDDTSLIFCQEGYEGNVDETKSYVNVIFNANEGTINGKEYITNQALIGSTLLSPNNPKRVGYSFTGWSTQKEGGKVWKFATDYVKGNITLYATWKEESATILSVEGAVIDEDNIITMIVPNSTKTVSLTKMVVCTNDSIWNLYKDNMGTVEIKTRIATGDNGELAEGFNVFYIIVTSKDLTEFNTYTLLVCRQYETTITVYHGKDVLLIKPVTTFTAYDINGIDIQGYTFNYFVDHNEKVVGETYVPMEASIFYAITTPYNYTVALNANNGVGEDVLINCIYDEKDNLPINTFTRTGYTFMGWSLTEDGEVAFNDQAEILNLTDEDNGTVTLYAVWKANTYKVIYNADGGIGEEEQTFTYDGSQNLSVFIKTGYTFIGWATTQGGEAVYTEGQSVKNLTAEDNGVVNLYAKWTANIDTPYKVEYYLQNLEDDNYTLKETSNLTGTTDTTANAEIKTYEHFTYNQSKSIAGDIISSDGSLVLKVYYTRDTYSVTINKKTGTSIITISGNVYKYDKVISLVATNAGYTFNGWYNGEELLTENAEYTFKVESDITITASWEIITYSITYNLNGGTLEDKPTTYTVEDSITLGTPTKLGYTFAGWSNNGKIVKGSTGDKTFTASWTPTVYTITYNLNDGTNNNNPSSYTIESDTIVLNNPFKSTYTFIGWFDNNENIVECISKGSIGNIVLNAKWERYTLSVEQTAGGKISVGETEYRISFNMNGSGSQAPATQIINKTKGLSYPSIPTRSGYIFGGWYSDSSCTGSPYDFTATVESNKTLYAKWVSYSNASSFALNSSQTVYANSRSSSSGTYYAFVPLVSGSVNIYSNTSWDTYGYLYNSNKTLLTSDDDGGNGYNFSITYNVKAGTLYYFKVCGYNSSGNALVYLNCGMPLSGGKSGMGLSNISYITAGQITNISLLSTSEGYAWDGWYIGETLLFKGRYAVLYYGRRELYNYSKMDANNIQHCIFRNKGR